MPGAAHSATIFCFGVFELDLRAGELRKHGLKVHIQEKPLQILALLLEHPGEVVTREELRQRIWPADTFVDFDHSINTAVKKLREAVGDSAENPHFIETLPRHGYRFISHVEPPKVAGEETKMEVFPPTASEAGRIYAVDQPSGDSAQETGAHPEEALQACGRRDAPVKHRNGRRVAAVATVGVAALMVVLLIFIVANLRNHLLPGNRVIHGVPLPKISSIAVLPLENLSDDPAQEYFADGMTEELITDLGTISVLRVISRTSVMQYKGTRKPLPEIARELQVDAVVEGTVRRSGNRVRVTANLLYAPADLHLWAHTYERGLGDVLVLQREVARAIAREVQAELTPQEQTSFARDRPVNPEAYELYLKGCYQGNRISNAGLNKSLEYFQRAIYIDPGFAPAYSGIADSYLTLGIDGFEKGTVVFPKAKAAALKALKIDDTSAEAHASMGFALFNYDYDYGAATKELETATRLNPNYVTARP